jgi:uncharacterized protein with ParB-like and HNH nuclease domain
MENMTTAFLHLLSIGNHLLVIDLLANITSFKLLIIVILFVYIFYIVLKLYSDENIGNHIRSEIPDFY